jgi:hypothetical protein
VTTERLFVDHPQPFAYYLRLTAGGFRTMLDVALLVVGSGLVGLGVAVLLDGLEVAGSGLGLSTAAALGSSLVLGVIGAFAFGVASEGGYGIDRYVVGFPRAEIAIARALTGVVIAVGLQWGANLLVEVASDQNVALRAGVEIISAAGVAGIWVSIVGAPIVWALRRGLDRLGWGIALELPVLFASWAMLALALFEMPSS